MPLNDLWAVKVFCKQDLQLAVTTLHYQTIAATPVEPDSAFVASHMDAFWSQQYKALINNTATYSGVTAQKIFPLPQSLLGANAISEGPGTGGVEALPSQTCGLITKTTQFGGRKFRGRVYVPFPSKSQSLIIGHPTAAYLTLLDTFRIALLTQRVVTDGGNSITLHPVLKHGTTPPTQTLLANGIVRQRWATQRRRSHVNPPDF